MSDIEQVRVNNVNYDIVPQNTVNQLDNDYKNIPFKFGIDENGNYGYIKDGADTVTPFLKTDAHIYEYMQFAGNPITLNFTIQSNYAVEVCFDAQTYNNNEVIFGNLSSFKYSHLTLYNGGYYYGSNGEANFGSYTSGKHTFVLNDSQGRVLFDGNVVRTGVGIGAVGTRYTIGGNRPDGGNYYGRIYYFKITNRSTGDVVHELVPLKVNTNILLPDNYSYTMTYNYMYDKIDHTRYSAGYTVGGNIIE